MSNSKLNLLIKIICILFCCSYCSVMAQDKILDATNEAPITVRTTGKYVLMSTYDMPNAPISKPICGHGGIAKIFASAYGNLTEYKDGSKNPKANYVIPSYYKSGDYWHPTDGVSVGKYPRFQYRTYCYYAPTKSRSDE